MKNNNDDQLFFEYLEKLDQPNINVNLDFDIKADSTFTQKSISKRIGEKTFEKIGIKDRKPIFKIRYISVALSMSFLLIILFMAFGSNVIAQVKSLFYYAPGIGVVEKNTSSDAFVLTNLISYKGKESIQITGAKLDEDGFSINLNGNGNIPDISDFTVVDSSGKSFKFNSWLISSSEKGWEAFLTSSKNFVLKPEVTLKKGLDIIKINMKKSTNSVDMQGLGLTSSSNNIEISAIITRDNDKLRVSLIEKPGNDTESKIIQYGSTKKPVIALDQNGERLNISKIKYNEFYVDGISNVKNIKFTVPEITIEKKKSKVIKLNIPESGTLELNKKFELDGLITNIESVNRDSTNSISMVINTYFTEDSTRYLKYFTFHNKAVKLLNGSSFSFVLDPVHEFVTMYKGIEIDSENSALELVTDNIIIANRGNWTFDFDLANYEK